MLEICVSGFLAMSVAVSFLLWRALAAAKRADIRLQTSDTICLVEPAEDTIHRMRLVASAE
jgi:hypothetical protein